GDCPGSCRSASASCHPERCPERMRGRVEGPCVGPLLPLAGGFGHVDMLRRRIFEAACSQILPSGIESRDQPQLLFSSPALQLLFTRDGFVNVVIAFPIHETYGIVLIGKTLLPVHFVLKNTAAKIVGHADVEGPAGTALQHVDVEAIFAQHASDIARIGRRMRCWRSQCDCDDWEDTRSLDLPSHALGTALGMTGGG